MKNTEPRHRLLRWCISAIIGCCVAVLAHAQPATGEIRGRVYNPSTQEYVRNAEVQLEGTNQTAVTESDGSFRFTDVPAGQVTVAIAYTGYQTVRDTFMVPAGQVVNREITMASAATEKPKTGDVVQLEAVTVSEDREGNAKAIMAQRRSMNITTSVASDVFGDVTDGNVGEFLKFLPGIDVDYVESETRGPRLAGLDAQYTGVAFDGVRLASADANRTGDLGRATSFEAFSISSIESIEVNRTTTPDQDADSPAGTINMKTRRAFDRKGRRIGFNFSFNLNSEEFTISRTYGPDGYKQYKARPNYSLEYSDVFLHNRLGIVASINHVDSYTEQYRHNMTYNVTPEAADSRPMVITNLNFKDGNKQIKKDTYTITADYKVSPQLSLSSTLIYNYALGEFFNREINFQAANNNNNSNNGRRHVLGDGVTTVQTDGASTNTSQRNNSFGGSNAAKETTTVTAYQKFEYKVGSWLIDGLAAYSRSINNYEALEKGFARTEDLNNIPSDWIATRSGPNSYEWTVQQLTGADWFNLANRKNPEISNEGRYQRTETYTGALNAQWKLPITRIPTLLKFGGKWNEEGRKGTNATSYYTYSYVGPGGNVLNPDGTITTTGTWAAYPNRNFWSTGTTNILTVKDLNGNVHPEGITRVDDSAVGQLAKAHPEWFVNNATADNYYNAFIAPRRDVKETVTASYGMADVRVTRKLRFVTGVRWERTKDDLKEFDPLTNAEVRAAGYPVNTSARPTTIAGMQYQYYTKPMVHRINDYDDFFPMISGKYRFTQNLEFQAGWNEAISRPSPDSLTGAWLVNEDTHIVTSPNPFLKPERSKNFVARLAYYWEPAGELSVTVNQNDITNLRETQTRSAEDFGLGNDPVYGSYEFKSPYNIQGGRRFRSFELSHRQTVPLFKPAWGTLTFQTAFTRVYASQRRSGLLPRRITENLGYRYGKFSIRTGIVWRDNTPDGSATTDYGKFRRHDLKVDLGGEYRLTKNISLFFQGRNIFNDGQMWMQTPAGYIEGVAAAVRVYENYGANWNFGVKGIF